VLESPAKRSYSRPTGSRARFAGQRRQGKLFASQIKDSIPQMEKFAQGQRKTAEQGRWPQTVSWIQPLGSAPSFGSECCLRFVQRLCQLISGTRISHAKLLFYVTLRAAANA